MPEDPDLGEALSSARAAVTEHVERSGTVGGSMSVVIGKDFVARWAFGHAHTESKRPMEPSTVSDIGSVTKMFTATLLMILRDEGLVNLDDPVEAHWPPFEPISRLSGDRPITLRQLATHTSGIAFRQMFLPSEQPPGSLNELVAQLADRGLVFPPGAGHKYSNAAFQILGEVIAARSGMPFASLLHDRLLEPLGMVDTNFDTAAFDPERLAFGYRRGARRGIPLETKHPIMADGGLVSTVDDLARFLSLQWQSRPDVLSPTTVRELLAPAYLDPQWEWA